MLHAIAIELNLRRIERSKKARNDMQAPEFASHAPEPPPEPPTLDIGPPIAPEPEPAPVAIEAPTEPAPEPPALEWAAAPAPPEPVEAPKAPN